MRRLLLIAVFCISVPCLAQEYHGNRCPGDYRCFWYGYVEANVVVHGPTRKFIKVASEVFPYCYLEVSADHIAEDAKRRIAEDAAAKYGTPIDKVEVGFIGTTADDSREKAEARRAYTLRAAGFADHITSSYSWVAYSGKCHN